MFSAYYFSQHRRHTHDQIIHEVGTSEDESSDDDDHDDQMSGEYVADDKPPSLLSRNTVRLLFN